MEVLFRWAQLRLYGKRCTKTVFVQVSSPMVYSFHAVVNHMELIESVIEDFQSLKVPYESNELMFHPFVQVVK